jgi:hypothetical protein
MINFNAIKKLFQSLERQLYKFKLFLILLFVCIINIRPAYAVITVVDPTVNATVINQSASIVAAINAANKSITAQIITTNTLATDAAAYNKVLPVPLSAAAAALASPTADIATVAELATPVVGEADAIAQYKRFTPLEVATCSDGGKGLIPAGTIGLEMLLRCRELQNLKAYSIRHTTQYLLKLNTIQLQLAALAKLPEGTTGLMASKQAALNYLGQIQSTITSSYRAQRDIINSKMAIAEDIRKSASDQLTGGRSSNPMTTAITTATKIAIGAGITAVATTFNPSYR